MLGEQDYIDDHLEDHSNESSSFDPVLYKNLVEMVPLIESLMDDGKAKTKYTRRASLVYTKTPTKDLINKKVSLIQGREQKGKKISQPIPSIKQKDVGDKRSSKEGSIEDFSIISSRASTMEKNREELAVLQEQVESLQHKLFEKDELLKSAETSISQMRLLHAKMDELKRQVAEKESLIKSAHLQLSDIKVKLEDKQAALEIIQWEVTTSNQNVEELQEQMETIQEERSAFLLLFDSITKDGCTAYAEDHNTLPSYSEQLPYSCIDDMDAKELPEMEDAREAYISAIAAAKETHDEELLTIAAQARLRLQTFVLKPQSPSSSVEGHWL